MMRIIQTAFNKSPQAFYKGIKQEFFFFDIVKKITSVSVHFKPHVLWGLIQMPFKATVFLYCKKILLQTLVYLINFKYLIG